MTGWDQEYDSTLFCPHLSQVLCKRRWSSPWKKQCIRVCVHCGTPLSKWYDL